VTELLQKTYAGVVRGQDNNYFEWLSLC